MGKKRKATSAPVGGREDLLVRVEEAQRKAGCVCEGFIFETAQTLGLPVSEVYGVTTFYSFLSVATLGQERHTGVQVCSLLSQARGDDHRQCGEGAWDFTG